MRSGILAVQNHSRDHNHPASDEVCQKDGVRGRFDNIDTFEECDSEVTRAADYIESRSGVRPSVFAYPWGQFSSYMRDVYFPRISERHRCRAAFAAHGGFVTRDSCIWALPRLVFRANWSTSAELRALLEAASRPDP